MQATLTWLAWTAPFVAVSVAAFGLKPEDRPMWLMAATPEASDLQIGDVAQLNGSFFAAGIMAVKESLELGVVWQGFVLNCVYQYFTRVPG